MKGFPGSDIIRECAEEVLLSDPLFGHRVSTRARNLQLDSFMASMNEYLIHAEQEFRKCEGCLPDDIENGGKI